MRLRERTPLRLLLVLAVVGSALMYLDTSRSEELKPFTSDGCSAFPDGTLQYRDLWQACCTAHDLAYWQGGTRAEREQADLALRACVQQVGEPQIAELMLQGVRVGGSPYWPTTYRWGYGWPWPRGYGELTAEERAQIEALRPTSATSARAPIPETGAPASTGSAPAPHTAQ